MLVKVQNDTKRRDKLWQAYKQHDDQGARDELLTEYLPLVKYVAGRLAINLPSNVDVDDLESFGFFGLMDALTKFDASRKIKFETYASTRIRGAIIDGMRSMDWVPRSTRAKARSLEKQILRLTNDLGRNPEDQEVAAALEISPDRYYDLLNEVSSAYLFSLDEPVATGKSGDSLKVLDLVIDENEAPEEAILEDETLQELTQAIESLTEREQLMLALYYKEELTLKEIGHVLEVSESRVSQIHTKVIATLRSKLG